MSIPGPVLQVASIGMSLLGGFMQYRGARQEAAAQQASANYQAAVARQNAVLARRAAADALERGREEETRAAIEGRQLLGRQAVVLAGGGLDPTFGSALDVQSETAGLVSQDLATIRRNAELEAADFRTRAGSLESEAQFLEAGGRFARQAGRQRAFSGLLRTGGLVADKWYRFSRSDEFFGDKFFGPT